MPRLVALAFGLLFSLPALAQQPLTSGGPLRPAQAAYDVTFYDLALAVDPQAQTIAGTLGLHARIVLPTDEILLDLHPNYRVASVVGGALVDFDPVTSLEGTPPEGVLATDFERGASTIRVFYPRVLQPGEEVFFLVEYAGSPRVAPQPPWDGGFTWAETPGGEPWVAVSGQGQGADLWWPVKDHPSDEPDSMRIALTVPEGLRAVSNGRLRSTSEHADGTATYEWFVSTPINNYAVSFVAAPLVEVTFRDTAAVLATDGERYSGLAETTAYVLPSREADTRRMIPHWHAAVQFLEETFGPYPFRADKYAVVHTPFLGMEYQTLNSYGSTFQLNEYGFDWLHFHEAAHEWWGNLVTASDWRDFWIHEGFATYSEALYAESLAEQRGDDGAEVYRQYVRAWAPRIQNVQAIAPRGSRTTTQITRLPDGRGSNDIYFKGAAVLHLLRWMTDDDAAFKTALRRIAYPDPEMESVTDGSQTRFVSTADVTSAFALHTRLTADQVDQVFDVYLRQPYLPQAVLERDGDQATVRWEVPSGLPLEIPVEVAFDNRRVRLDLTGGEATFSVPAASQVVVDPDGWLLIAR